MYPNVARSDLASCRTRRIRAKLFRRVHRLSMFLLHKHIMPMVVAIFKPLPQFHRLVRLYLDQLSDGEIGALLDAAILAANEGNE